MLIFAKETLPSEFDIPFPIDPSGLGIDKKGNLFIGDRRTIASGEEDDRMIYQFSPMGNFIGEVSGYRGSVAKIVVDAENRLYVFNKEDQKITILKPVRVLEKKEKSSFSTGIYFSTAFDSTEFDTQWHKLVLDRYIATNSQIEVSYLISNQKTFSINGSVQDLDSFMADMAISSEQKVNVLNELNWSVPILNPKDALIRGPAGRYLWLRVNLISSEDQTPVVKSIRVVFPRISYLRYLPAVYQEDERSRDFLERFLALFETLLVNVESEIQYIARYFDADVVSEDYLCWLASWLSVIVDENWPEEKLRLIVKRAPELYKQRGTRRGIEELIKIFIGERPLIVEQFQLQCAREEKLKQLLKNLYGNNPYSFCVLLKPYQVKSDHELIAIRRILELEKPAHTCVKLLTLQPWIYLDMHTYLGVNTYLSQPSPRLENGSMMPRDTVLLDVTEAGQIDRRSRLNIDTSLT